MKIVAVSGGFDPIHVGHLAMFEEAKELGDYLIVILNGDEWLVRKKGYAFMPATQRAAIIGALECVDEVFIWEAEENDVCGALSQLRPDVFANGGDRKADNTPELLLCSEIGIELAWNVGGGKVESSSELVRTAMNQILMYDEGARDEIKEISRTTKPWGFFKSLDGSKESGWFLKTLHFEPKQMTSLQSHKHRAEHWMLVEGSARAATKDMPDGYPITPFHSVCIPQGITHRIIAGDEGAVIVEVMEGEYDEDDIVRLEDKYGRT